MAIETERKFLVDKALWTAEEPVASLVIRQGYMHSDHIKTIRVRTLGDRGFLTVKGKTRGISRVEYEYEIPFDEATDMLDSFSGSLVEKTRHYILYEGKTWEVDEFAGHNAGLLVAEIELDDEEESFAKPLWAGEEVTHDYRYSNSSLAEKPFATW